MPACAKCGKEIPRRSAIQKMMQTGTYADGGAFMRNVNLCPKCAAEEETAERTKERQKVLLLVVAVVAVIGGAVYWFFLRP